MTTGRERIDAAFGELRTSSRRGLVPFVVGGHPVAGVSADVLRAIDDAGASVIEVGIPFSDPIADGPVIASAMHDALESGVTVRTVLDSVAAVSGDLRAPLIAMVSVSIVERFGATAFATMLAEAGFAGAIFPDAPLEEAEPLTTAADAAGLSASLLIAPSTPTERARQIAAASSGFVYLVARAGITGAQDTDPSDQIAARVATLREASNLPIACGFGISTARHVAMVTRHADAAIVGSALVDRLTTAAAEGQDVAEAAGSFTAELAAGVES